MLLQIKEDGTLVEVRDIQEVINPNQTQVRVQIQSGQEEQDIEPIQKEGLIFPSGESLPRCWMDADYQSN